MIKLKVYHVMMRFSHITMSVLLQDIYVVLNIMKYSIFYYVKISSIIIQRLPYSYECHTVDHKA